MGKYDPSQRIKYGLHLEGWSFENGDQLQLQNDASIVLPSEYTEAMEGNIFCPVCKTNLTRVPKNKEHFTNVRKPHFSHQKKYKSIQCDLRVKRSEGKQYENFEEAQKAIDDENLVIVSSFLSRKPERQADAAGQYDETPVEDQEGPPSMVPLARHTGEELSLPSKITTVAGICRKFDDNLYKYYFMPGRQHPVPLIDLLQNIKDVIEEDHVPRLYWGRIKRSFTPKRNPQPENMRMTELECASSIPDFYLKTSDGIGREKGINDETSNRLVLMWGKVTRNGVGLCIEGVNWGEFALLPSKYNYLLDDELPAG